MPTALVTGASSGIGMWLADECAADGHEVVLVARRVAILEEWAAELRRRHGVAITVVSADLSRPGSPQALADNLATRGLAVDVLVNNAGFGTLGRFLDSELRVQLEMIEVNITSITALTRLLVPGMVERGQGYVLNVASTAAFQPGPWMSVYYATKAYLLHFSEALASELAGSGVSVTTLCPGPTRTGFQERARMGTPTSLRRPFMDARDVARIGYRAMKQRKRVVVPGLANRLLAQLYRWVPRRVMTAAVRRIQEP